MEVTHNCATGGFRICWTNAEGPCLIMRTVMEATHNEYPGNSKIQASNAYLKA